MKNNQKIQCQVCKKEFPKAKLFPAALIRPTISEYIKSEYPDWSSDGFICNDDLKKYRGLYIEKILTDEKGELSHLDQEVLDSLKEYDLITENINKQFEKELTFGERLADRVARFGGSWTFITIFLSIILIWMIINTILIITKPFDPYPFILLNLVLSCLAALQAPIIMMSQNRQADKDRLQADDDYRTNLKAELEIRQLHSKFDQFMKKQWERMLELQHIQIELQEDLVSHNYKHREKQSDS